MDKIEIEITDNGLFKISTDAVSQPNHALAEGLIRKMQSLAGGTTTRRQKPNALAHHHHGHAHGHTHSHGGQEHTH